MTHPPRDDADPGDSQLVQAAQTVLEIAAQQPTEGEVLALMEQLQPAVERGYFYPDEDEQVRRLFARYLRLRQSLFELLNELRGLGLAELNSRSPARHDVFLVAFSIVCLLSRMGCFVIGTFRERPVIWKKLDEAEPVFGIPRKQFTRVYRSLTDRFHQWVLRQGLRHFETHRDAILEPRESPELNALAEMLASEVQWQLQEGERWRPSRVGFLWHSIRRRNQSALKQFSFGLFETSGRLLSELRWKAKRKRVTPIVLRKISKFLQPGDVIITRHDDAATNLFLPGFWPHAALYLGTDQQRQLLPAEEAEAGLLCPLDPLSVLEALKDGVRFRPLQNTLAVDACVVLRPRLSAAELAAGLSRAARHEGKPYDFEFDFRRSDRMVCTEVVYRAFHGLGQVQFELKSRAGRQCLSAEDLLDGAVDRGLFEVVLVYGARRNRFVQGERALEELVASYRPGRLPTAQSLQPAG